MKKWLKTGKKALSVIMAVMMVLTAWVWVAPEKASAATAGTYDVQVRIQTTDSVDVGDNEDLVLTLNYNKDNGSGSAGTAKTENVSYTWANEDNADNTWTINNLDGYPTSFSVYCLYAWTAAIQRVWGCTIYINVKDNDTGTWTEVAKQSFSENGGSWGQTPKTYTISSIGGTPEATRVTFLSGAESIDIPKTGASSVTETYTAGVYDQYGVRMTHEPKYWVRSTAPTSAQSSSSSITGVSMSSGTSSGTMTVTSGAQNTTADTKDVYVHATYGTVYANKTVALNDPSYTFKYNKNTSDSSATISPSSDTSKKYYNTFGDTAISGTRTGFSFIGFYKNAFDDSYETPNYSGTYLSSATRYTADTTWYAAWQANKHTLTFNYRDDNNEETVYTVEDYYGRTYEMPSAPEYIYEKVGDVVNVTHHLSGWKVGDSVVTPPATIPDQDVTYLAYYDTTHHYADYDALEEQITLAKNKQTEDLYVAGAYTDSSVQRLVTALEAAEYSVANPLYLSEQAQVDRLTEELKDAREKLDIKNFTVVFVDEDGTILKDGYFFVPYGATIEVPENPEKTSDEANHYTFKEWDSEESDSIAACNYVTNNLIFVASFNAIPHTYTESKTPSTCTADGVITYTCDCGYSYTAVDADDLASHKWSSDYKELIPATCATAGSEALYCTACGAIDDSSKREITKLGHNFGEYTEYTPATCFGKGLEIASCSRCQALDVKEIAQKTHNYGEAETVEKTCTTDGYTKKVCTLCGFTDMTVDKATGHSTSIATTDATCVSVGYKKTTCANCDYEKTEIIPATGVHTYPDTWVEVSAASCVGHGVEKRVCTVCNAATETRLTDLASHSEPADWTVEVPASCDGEGRQVKDCTVCGKQLKAESITKLGHSYEAYSDGSYEATCTTAGASAEKCSRCGDINTTIIQPLTHDWDGGVKTDATCTSGAYKTFTCQRPDCGETYVQIIDGSAALLHDFDETIAKNVTTTAASCTDNGSKTVKCSRCDVTTDIVIPRLGHSYGDWEVVKEATNDEDGEWKRTCANCKDVETITIPKGGHNLVEDTAAYKAPTCNAKGEQVYKCTNHTDCSVNVTVELDYAQHTVAQNTTAATCTQPGKVEAYCSVCDTNCENPFSTTEIPLIPHVLDNGTEHGATCTTSGYTTYKCQADGCTFSYNEYDASKPATGHNYVAEETTAAGCTSEGLMTYTCACGESYTEAIPATGHTYVKGETTTANCTTAGTEVYSCSCGDTYTKFIEAAKGHSWGEYVETQAATADNYGIKERTCSVCHAVEIAKTAPIGDHVFVEKVIKEATCTAEGEKSFTCSKHTDCSANYTETIPATGHKGEAKYTAPTCIATGSSKLVCSVCDNELASESIPVIYHDFSGDGEVTTAPTCEGTGVMTYTCETDGCTATKTETIPAKGHELTTTVTDAKCGEAGEVVTICANCDDPNVEKTTVLAAKGHIWKDTPESTVAAKCEADGSKTYKCQFCEEINVVVIPKLGHEWGKWTVTPSTNDKPGSVSRTCLRGCTESVEIPAGGHELVLDKENSTDASCSAEGTLVYICENHNDCAITVSVSVPMTQHTLAQNITEATCTQPGKVEVYCSICDVNCENPLKTAEIPVIPHDFDNGKKYAATCTTSGYTTYKCEKCTFSYNEYDASKPATGHTLTEGVSTATCTSAGTKTLTCSVCNNYSTRVSVPALGHNYVKQGDTVEATCKTPAVENYKCNVCGDAYIKYVGDKTTNHTWSAYTEVSATNTSLGYRTRSCTVCDQVEFEIIPATGAHNFTIEESRSPATCTADGSLTYKCSAHTSCGETSTVTLPKLGHTETFDYKAATCTQEGHAKMVCSVCDSTLEEKTIPVLGHLYNGEGTVTPATCMAAGSVVYTCQRENCTETKTTEIPRDFNSHDYSTTTTQPTCYEEGSVVTICTREGCGSKPVDQTLAKIDHTWNEGEVKTSATCEADGVMLYTCTVENCDATKEEEIDTLGHAWGEWTVTKASTNTATGIMTRTCLRGCTESVEIPAGGHNLVASSTEPASCTETGSVTYDCDVHKDENDCGISITVTLDKLQHELETTKTDAKCEEAGTVVTKCKNCDTTTITTTIPATGHTYDKGVKTDATCTSTGKIVYTCEADGCGETREVTLEKLQHNYVAGTPVAATCTSSGYTPYRCETCTSSYVIVTADALGHSYEEIESTDKPDCKNGGTKLLDCEYCDSTIEVAVPALGHDYQLDSTTAATCAAAATETYKCSRCSDAYTISVDSKTTNHDWNDWVTVEKATNTSLGYKTRTCKVCDKLEVETIPATGEHVFDVFVSEVKADCENAGEKVYGCSTHTGKNACNLKSTVTVPATGHKEVLKYTAATCDKEGSTKTVCETCKETISDVVTIPALGHLFDGEGDYTAATCSKTGSMVYTCSRNGCTKTHTTIIAADPDAHDYERAETPATCKADGSVVITCNNEGCGYNKTITLNKLQHSWNAWTVVGASTNDAEGLMRRTCSNGCIEEVEIPAGGHVLEETDRTSSTCTVAGSVTYECKVNHTGGVACGVKVVSELPLAGHTPKTEVLNSSCTSAGTVCTTCEVCGDELVDDIPLGLIQHDYDKGVVTAPTCISSGYTTYTCQKCNHSYKEIGDAPIGHDLVTAPSGATCTEGGKVIISCNNCSFNKEVEVPALGHDYQVNGTTAATCKSPATKTYKCSRCVDSYTVSEGTATDNHNFTEWTVVAQPSETTLGYETRTCSDCGKLEGRSINATGEHEFTVATDDNKPATCTEAGYKVLACAKHNDCGLTATEVIPATGHTKVAIAAVAPTCTTTGASAGEKCTACGTVLVAPVELPALGHSWGKEVVTPATCVSEGKIDYTCVNNNCTETNTVPIPVDDDAHNLKTKVVQATCEVDGSVTVSCDNDGCDYSEEPTVIPAKGHRWNSGTVTKPAACETTGVRKHACLNCTATSEEIIPALGHVYKAGNEVAPTCTTSGYTVYTCENDADHKYNVYDEKKPATGHDYKQVEGSSTATCTDAGKVTLKCSCGDEITTDVPALGHSWGSWKTTINPTANAEGEKTRACTRNGCTETETVNLPMLGHSMIKDTTASIAPTCTAEGEDVYVCTTHTDDAACGYSYKVKVAAKGHSYGEGVINKGDEATCTADGTKTFTCTADGCDSKITEVVPKTGHTLRTIVNEATCENAGTVVTECSACDFELTETLEIKPHTISLSTVYPGCETDGYAVTRCDACNKEIQKETIKALGHDYSGKETVVTPASCADDGKKTVECTRCDAVKEVIIPQTAHTFVPGEEVKATCTESGYIINSCSCGRSYKELVSNPLGHDWDNGEITTSATCTKDGEKTFTCERKDCGATKTEVVSKFGHSWGAWEVVVNPTATEDGVQMRKCLRADCGATESVIIPALGGVTTYTVDFVVDGEVIFSQTVNHGGSATAPEVSNKAPDAKYHYSFKWDTDFSKVTKDLTVTAVFTAADHSFGEWVTDVKADCKNEGSRHRTCDCGYVATETVAKTEHSFTVVKSEKDPTCTENGYKVVACANCGDSETQTIKRLGHIMNYIQGVDATCDTDGVLAHYSCSRCGKLFGDRAGKTEYTTVVVQKKYHTFVLVPGKDPTCTDEGVTDYRYCTACGYTQHPETIPATGHADANHDNACDKCGSTYIENNTRVCSCSCHKSGIFNELIYKILSFFWKLFGMNKSCECGKVHY